MDADPAAITERLKRTLSDLLGIRFVEATPERVVAELTYCRELTTRGGSLHGGTLMAFADTVGAVATVLNLPPGAGTPGSNPRPTSSPSVARASSAPRRPHGTGGKRTLGWPTWITDDAGRRLSHTIQTPMGLA